MTTGHSPPHLRGLVAAFAVLLGGRWLCTCMNTVHPEMTIEMTTGYSPPPATWSVCSLCRAHKRPLAVHVHSERTTEMTTSHSPPPATWSVCSLCRAHKRPLAVHVHPERTSEMTTGYSPPHLRGLFAAFAVLTRARWLCIHTVHPEMTTGHSPPHLRGQPLPCSQEAAGCARAS